MSFRVLFTPEAKRNLAATMVWLQARSSTGADRWYDALWRTVQRLESNPTQFGIADEAHEVKQDIRQATFRTRHGRTYRLVFRIRHDLIQVVAIRGSGQRPLTSKDLQ